MHRCRCYIVIQQGRADADGQILGAHLVLGRLRGDVVENAEKVLQKQIVRFRQALDERPYERAALGKTDRRIVDQFGGFQPFLVQLSHEHRVGQASQQLLENGSDHDDRILREIAIRILFEFGLEFTTNASVRRLAEYSDGLGGPLHQFDQHVLGEKSAG